MHSEMFACAKSVVQVVRRLRTALTTLGRYLDPEVVISGVFLNGQGRFASFRSRNFEGNGTKRFRSVATGGERHENDKRKHRKRHEATNESTFCDTKAVSSRVVATLLPNDVFVHFRLGMTVFFQKKGREPMERTSAHHFVRN